MSALSRMLVPVVCLQSEDTAVRQSWSRMKWPSCVLIEQWIYKHGAMKNVRTPAQRAPNASMVVIVVTIVTREVCHPKMENMKNILQLLSSHGFTHSIQNSKLDIY